MESTAKLQSTHLEALEDEEACLFAMQLASLSALPMVLKSVIELDLLETIAKAGPGAYVSPSWLASKLPSSNPGSPVMLDRMLRLLSSYSILDCKLNHELPDGHIELLYGLAPVCKFLTKNADDASMAPPLLLNTDKIMIDSWYHLKDAVIEGGIPFIKAHGMAAYDYTGTDPRFKKVFNKAMYDHSTITMRQILEIYNGFEGLSSVVDVGGGIGATLNMIVSKYPSIQGINFDLPHVVRTAPSYPGVEHVGGDMFAGVPKGDAIFMKWICHNWSDDQCLKVLKNCYEALVDNGRVIVAEYICPHSPDATLANKVTLQMDLIMLRTYSGGKERTEKEFETLAKGAGFKCFNKTCCAFNTWIMEFHK